MTLLQTYQDLHVGLLDLLDLALHVVQKGVGGCELGPEVACAIAVGGRATSGIVLLLAIGRVVVAAGWGVLAVAAAAALGVRVTRRDRRVAGGKLPVDEMRKTSTGRWCDQSEGVREGPWEQLARISFSWYRPRIRFRRQQQ